MIFKNDEITGYWKRVDWRIRVILSFLDLFCKQKYGREITVTELIRLRPQQIMIYQDTPKYKGKPHTEIPHSVHEYGRGADVRTHGFTKEQINEMLELLNKLPYGDSTHDTAIYHDIGTGEHIHIQVRYA